MFRVMRDLLGLACWGARCGWGSCLTLDFGEPHLDIRERVAPDSPSPTGRPVVLQRSVQVRGAWHLWVYACEWRLTIDGRTVRDAQPRKIVDKALQALDGQALVGVLLNPRGARTRFLFDLGAVLETRPWDRKGEQWMLFMPDRRVLTFRADRRYSLHRADRVLPVGEWRAA